MEESLDEDALAHYITNWERVVRLQGLVRGKRSRAKAEDSPMPDSE